MPNHDIVVIGASAGGVEALKRLVENLPDDLCAALFVVVHFPANSFSALPQILNRYGTLPAHHPEDAETIQPGQIYVAVPGKHLVLRAGKTYLDQGPRENGFRPAIDRLFFSAAQAYRQRVVGIVLSGTLDDGTAGLQRIKQQGGIALVQSPEEALFDGMPRSAIAYVAVDAVLKVSEMGPYLKELVQTPVAEEVAEEESAMTDQGAEAFETRAVAEDRSAFERGERPGTSSMLTCPDCGGVLWELRENGLLRFRCHVGHAYSPDSLQEKQADDVERALWSACRALEEKVSLSRRMAFRAREQGLLKSEAQFLDRADDAKQQADLIRQLIQHQRKLVLPIEDSTGNGNTLTEPLTE